MEIVLTSHGRLIGTSDWPRLLKRATVPLLLKQKTASVQYQTHVTQCKRRESDNRQSLEDGFQSQFQRRFESSVQSVRRIAPRKLDTRVINMQELTQRVPAIFNIVLQQSVLRHQRADMLVMPIISGFGIVREITIEKDFPATLEGWAGPATVHAQELGDRDQAFGQRVRETTFTSLKARSSSGQFMFRCRIRRI